MLDPKWLYIPFNREVLLRTFERTLWYLKATGRECFTGLRGDQNWKVPS